MAKSNVYLVRYAWHEKLIQTVPNKDLGLVVVIPCYYEKDLIISLLSIYYCDLPELSVEVIVIINDAENTSGYIKKQNQRTYKMAVKWAEEKSNSQLQFHINYCSNLPKKHAGVGLARKIGMDEAIRRFEAVNNHQRGIVVCFDADSLCERNYLSVIENHFQNNPKTPACAIHFEHPTNGDQYDKKVYSGIIKYELFLRYYIGALRFANFPHAYQTIGSSMAVRSSVYQKQGGMNRRKAGEDFYFLHKIIPLGNFTEINTTKVTPSPRPSDRVPFGTGRAINQWLETEGDEYKTYHPQTFIDLKIFIKQVDQLYTIEEKKITLFLEKLPESISSFLESQDFSVNLIEIRRNCGNSLEAFRVRFFKWFNGFKVLKFTHYARDQYYAEVAVEEAGECLLKEYFGVFEPVGGALEQLKMIRAFDRKGIHK